MLFLNSFTDFTRMRKIVDKWLWIVHMLWKIKIIVWADCHASPAYQIVLVATQFNKCQTWDVNNNGTSDERYTQTRKVF